MVSALCGVFLMLCGNSIVAAILALAAVAFLSVASNAKHAMLGESLLFSDLAMVGAIFRHPQFYLSAVKMWQRVVAAVLGAVLIVALWQFFVSDWAEHLKGGVLLVTALAGLSITVRYGLLRGIANQPEAHADIARHGLLPVVLLYWLRWREMGDPPTCTEVTRQPADHAGQLLVMIQCESFADPVAIFGNPDHALPGLGFARQHAWQRGRLLVSGFGAYTMRTEYGVLFGLEEGELGFRRYDPFLTALNESSYALPARLKPAGWRSVFLHPHDMRFYNRAEIMPASGFAELVGEEAFESVAPESGRYVSDADMAVHILSLAQQGAVQSPDEPQFLYAVTIENHGPWASETGSEPTDLVESYVKLARNSDAMLMTLIEGMQALQRPSTLVFFGDHRPSIPGASMPGGARYTPYVIMRFDESGNMLITDRDEAITPAQLHHTILDITLGTVH